MDDQTYFDEVLEGVEPYDGLPDLDLARTNENGDQDDELSLGGGLTLFAKTSPVRSRDEALAWLAKNDTAAELGFNPDGMCFKIARLARNVGPKYLTAKQGQDNTPAAARVHRVADLRKGMVLYFDDPRDNNPSGHIVTMLGRVPGFNPDFLSDILVKTNSVLSGRLVTVRGDYFEEHWGDEFQFGATEINDVDLPMAEFASKIEKFNDGGPVYHLNLLRRAGEDRPAAQRVLDGILRQVNGLPDSPRLVRIREFKDKVRSKEQILDMGLLNTAADHAAKGGRIQRARDEIRRLIKSLPDV
jgi:hypothetical protein